MRKYVDASTKQEILAKLKSPVVTQKNISKEYEISEPFLSILKRKAHEIVDTNVNLIFPPKCKKIKGVIHKDLDEIVYRWLY